MAKIYKSVSSLIGNTPLLELTNIEKKYDLKANIYAKLEYLNPAGSIKDRVANAMIEKAMQEGLLKKDSVIIEPTSGNTGIGLASVGAAKGYRVIIVMPDTMSIERRKIMQAYGAEVILSDGKLGMQGAIKKAEEVAANIPNSFIPNQFENYNGVLAHENSTAIEIFNDTDGNVDIVVAGVGTGGTISGIGHYLKKKKPEIKMVAIEPASSPLLSEGKSGAHSIQGIGANFVPKILDLNIIDEIMKAKNEDAFEMSRLMGKTEGVLVGISSGAALYGAIELAKRPENVGKKIVVIFPDSGERYLSTSLYQ